MVSTVCDGGVCLVELQRSCLIRETVSCRIDRRESAGKPNQMPHYRIASFQKSLPQPTVYRQKSPGRGGFLPVNCWPGRDFSGKGRGRSYNVKTFLSGRRHFKNGETYQVRDYLSQGGFFVGETF